MKRHLIIGGTGRAGTSFLVQYLTKCGVETHWTTHPDEGLDEHAHAGLEDVPVVGANLSYVIKSPWLYEYVDDILDREDVIVDAVILPMRNLVEAAASRVTVEMMSRVGDSAENDEYTRWETWATTPGGVVFSLNPIDQARILAMGFHQVVHACVKRQIPLVFLDFPRFVDDAGYLYDQLEPVIGASVQRQAALEAHQATARKDYVRVTGELSAKPAESAESGALMKFPSHEGLTRSALLRELKAREASLKEAEAALQACRAERAEEKAQNDARKAELERENAEALRALDEKLRTVASIYASRSWRLTGVLRDLRRRMIG